MSRGQDLGGSELKCKRAAELGNARVWECWEGPALLSRGLPPCRNNWRESFSWTGFFFSHMLFLLESSEQDEPKCFREPG